MKLILIFLVLPAIISAQQSCPLEDDPTNLIRCVQIDISSISNKKEKFSKFLSILLTND